MVLDYFTAKERNSIAKAPNSKANKTKTTAKSIVIAASFTSPWTFVTKYSET